MLLKVRSHLKREDLWDEARTMYDGDLYVFLLYNDSLYIFCIMYYNCYICMYVLVKYV